MTRYVPARHWLYSGITALVLAGFSGWLGLEWQPALIPAVLFVLSSSVFLFLAFRPGIEIHEDCLVVGKRRILWMDIRRLDRTGWISPLVVRVTVCDGSTFLLIYPGNLDCCDALLRDLWRLSRPK